VSGLASGLDWRNIIDQIRKLEHQKIDLIENRKKTYQDRISAWQGINTKLLSLKNAAGTLNRPEGFHVYTTALSSNTITDAENILSASTGTEASPGTYRITVNTLASAQKLSSTSFGSRTTALNLSGDIVIGGRTVALSATDTLSSLRDKINAVNSGTDASGVTASIVNFATSGYRLILTSDTEGFAGISLLNGGASDLLGTLGFIDASAKIAKNVIANGHKSDAFSAAEDAVGGGDVLNLTDAQSGSIGITINGTTRSVDIDLATDSLNTIRDRINTAFSGVFSSDPASVVTSNADGTTAYRLLIEGNSIAYTDANNILETLGILKRAGVSDERGVTGDVANTSNGMAVTSSTLLKDIDGYGDYTSGDTITLTGTGTDGATVSSVMTITDTTTVGDLLSEISSRYGEVTASVTADGKVRVVDNEIGDTDLSVVLTPGQQTLRFDADGNLGVVSTIRQRQTQAGADASLSIDGVAVSSASNTVDDLIPGVTLHLRGADSETTVTLTVGRDEGAVKEKIDEFVSAYNETVDAIQAQLTYDSEKQKPGGPLFGDNTLKAIKSNLQNLILNKVSGVSDGFSTFGMVGISLGRDGKLTVDDTKLQDYLETNFDDVKKLFAADWSSSSSNLSYIYHGLDTKAGVYPVQITGLNPLTGYFLTPGDATGSGETLRGASGNAKGLSVRYSGTATGPVGTLTLTFGVAEMMNQTLYRVTNPLGGFISGKQDTLQETVDNLEEDVEAMETRLDQRMAEMERRFIAMEMALTTMQSQTSWLSGQINAANQGW
jgi:flagellar hook-associated protein 2